MKRNIYKTAVGAVLMALSMAMTSFGAGQAAREAENTAAKGPGIAEPAPAGNPVENGEIIPVTYTTGFDYYQSAFTVDSRDIAPGKDD